MDVNMSILPNILTDYSDADFAADAPPEPKSQPYVNDIRHLYIFVNPLLNSSSQLEKKTQSPP